MKFEWDPVKAEKNARKHGVDFEVAARVFLDPMRLEVFDADHVEDEDRWRIIGMVNPVVLVVIYTERGPAGESIRIISARKANEQERKAYHSIRA